MFRTICIILACFSFLCSNASNILYLNILSSPSHLFWNGAIANALAARGHNITMITPVIDRNPPVGVHYIHIENLDEVYYGYNKKKVEKLSANPFVTSLKAHFAAETCCIKALQSIGFQTLLNYSNEFKFDLVIYDYTLGPCLLPFVHKFNYPPLVAVSAFSRPSYLVELIGGHHHFSYVPHNVFFYEGDMTFVQRFLNFAIYLEEYIMRKYYLYPRLDAAIAKYFGQNTPTVQELQQRSLIALLNTNAAIDYAEPLPENVIPIGGLHIKDEKPLPPELEKFVNLSESGVVVFSLGTNVRSEFITVEKQLMFIKIFQQLPQYNFLWKFESISTQIKLPANVQIWPWIPQSDVLAHQNCKAIIAHGGALSTQEAIFHGIPLLIIPFVYDQIRNALRSKCIGIAEIIDYHTVNETEFKMKLLEILKNPKYATNAKMLSKRFQDQKEKPLERAIWWIEWAIRNPDGEHMKSPVLKLGYIVGNSFDVIACVTLLLFAIVYGTLKFLYFILKKIRYFAPSAKHSHPKCD